MADLVFSNPGAWFFHCHIDWVSLAESIGLDEC
jgi:FtsP/CotA-like multicopper oxidase with cupredoxin domain